MLSVKDPVAVGHWVGEVVRLGEEFGLRLEVVLCAAIMRIKRGRSP